MADDQFSLHIDSDWKKQAQEEKRRLVEAEQKRAAAPPTPLPNAVAGDPRGGLAAPGGAARDSRGAPGRRELPPPNFSSLVQSMVTQVLYYLGELSPGGNESPPNLDMAKHKLELLTMLEEKTANNLAPEEKDVLDHGLYETRMRYVNVASQFL